MTDILEWALKYQKHGFSVIPVGRDKKPLINWKDYQKKKATKEEVEAWFAGETPPNVGIVTGQISGITVVDVEKGGKWHDFPSTMTIKTGGGGVHLYYQYAPNVQNAVRIRELTDLRGDGGYVVAPPSLHASGEKYEFIKKENRQQFPFTMFNLNPQSKNDWESIVQGIGEGSRNETATKFIGKMIETFPPSQWKTTVWEMFVMWNLRNSPPLDEGELRSVFNSITGRALRSGSHKSEQEGDDCDIKLISEIAKDLTDDITISYPTGYKKYDEAFMGGLKEGDLVVVSGFTGQGKTMFCQSMTYNLVGAGQPCLWFSYEVTVGELWRKFKEMGVEDNFLAYSPEKTSMKKIDWVAGKIIDSRDRFQTKVIFIDHLGFLAEDPANYDANLNNNYSTRLTMICRRLKSLAIQENVAIVLMAHLKKPMNPTAEPTIHDLKDSSGIGQESDSVVIINRKKSSKGYGDNEVYDKESSVRVEKNRRTGKTVIFSVEVCKGRLMDTDEAFQHEVKSMIKND